MRADEVPVDLKEEVREAIEKNIRERFTEKTSPVWSGCMRDITTDLNKQLIDFSEDVDDYNFYLLDEHLLNGALEVILTEERCLAYGRLPVISEYIEEMW